MRLSESELQAWGRRLGETLTAPAVLALSGPLGAGKSVLARAIGEGAGVRDPMPSPTYTLVQRYGTASARELVHLDLYRIDSPDDLWELGWAQLPGEHDLVIVEWPEKAGGLLPTDHWRIELSVPPHQPHLRDVRITQVGSPPHLPAFPLAAGRD